MALDSAPAIVSIITQFFLLCSIEHKRKNWLFTASPKGAESSALVYTVVEMAKAHDLNVYKYLTYILEHRPNESMSDEQLEELTPWHEDVQQSCQN